MKRTYRKVQRRCTKCGRSKLRTLRARTCNAIDNRFGCLYYCGGQLEPVAEAPPPATTRPKATPQAKAARKAEYHNRKISELIADVARVARQLATHQQRARRYAALAARTDDDIAREREARRARKPKPNRAYGEA